MNNEKLLQLINLCEGKKFSLDHPSFDAVAGFLKTVQPHQVGIDDKARLIRAVCGCFEVTQERLVELVYGFSKNGQPTSRYHYAGYDALAAERELSALIPSSGYFRHYIEYTANSEAPLSYHFFSAVIGLASIINRRVHLPWGLFNYYPATGVILIGPSGLRKTSASDVAVAVIRDLALVEVYAEKITPEDLTNTMKGDNATGLIYAPEMSVMVNKKKYNEGLMELITRWMDCPDVWKSSTLSRGKCVLYNVGVSALFCSTPDWLMDNLPEGTFGGGFIARFLLVVQETTPRIVPKPEPLDPSEKERIKMELAFLHTLHGEMQLSEETYAAHIEWYTQHKRKSEHPEHELLGTYYQRKQAHVLRLAMCLHVGTHYDTDFPLILCLECHQKAVQILDWNERFLPNLFAQLFKTSAGVEQGEVFRCIQAAGGAISHVQLLRRLQHKFDAAKIKGLTNSLKEAGQVREENGMLGHMYVLEG